MITHDAELGTERPPLAALLNTHGRVMLLAATATFLVGCGAFLGGVGWGLPAQRAAMMALFATTVWIALLAAPLAAAADDWLGGLCRGGILADASILTLIVIGLYPQTGLSLLGGAMIYLLWAAIAIAASLAVRLVANRAAGAACVVVVTMVAAGSLFWSPGLLNATAGSATHVAATTVLAVNPMAAVIKAADGDGAFVWSQQSVMYGITRIDQDFPAPTLPGWLPGAIWWLAAAALTAVGVFRRSLRRLRWGV